MRAIPTWSWVRPSPNGSVCRTGASRRLGSDLPADLGPQAFLARLRMIAFQTDGGMGGWDNVAGGEIGRGTIVSGHFGEVLKAYAKRPPDGLLDPAAMVRLQAPFDPMEVLRPDARTRLVAALGRQMDEARAAGAEEADLPDLFYWRNRVPNWLGGIRGVKSFERQPVLPLGVPALMRLAFRMTAAERKAELAHYKLIEAAAPELIDLPFAHQSWHPSLGAPAARPCWRRQMRPCSEAGNGRSTACPACARRWRRYLPRPRFPCGTMSIARD